MSSERGMLVAAGCLLLSSLGAAEAERAPSSRPESAGALPVVEVERIVTGSHGSSRLWAGLAGSEPSSVLARPYGVAWDGRDLLVADPAAEAVVRFDPKGRAEATRAGLFQGPIGVAACASGIVVSDSRAGTVTLLDRGLRPIRALASGLARPTGVACAGERIVVVETAAHRLLELDSAGGVRRAIGGRGAGGGEFNFPAALARDGTDLWVGDTLNFRLQRLSVETGAALGSFGRLGDAPGETPRIKGIAVDGAGRLWISDAFLDTVGLFDAEGRLLFEIGGHGARPGEFSFPAGIAVAADGRVAVADSLNRRVQILRLAGTPRGAAP